MRISAILRRHAPILCGLFLLLVNFAICRRLFSIEYGEHMRSIEGAFFALARYLQTNWHDISWWPFWFGGMPFENTYQPALHVAVAAFSQALRISPALAYHQVTAAIYCLGALTLYALSYRLSGSLKTSFCIGLLWSLASPSTWVAARIRIDAGGISDARRLQSMVMYGDGPHVAALMLIPLAIVGLLYALRRRSAASYSLAACLLAIVPLTNWPGAIVLAAAVIALGLSQSTRRVWLTILGTGMFAYCLACPWLPPSALQLIVANAQESGPNFGFSSHHWLYLLAVFVCAWILKKTLNRIGAPPHLAFSIFFFLFMATPPLALEWFGLNLLPQPFRFFLAMEMGFLLTAGFAAQLLLHRFPALRRPAIALLIVGCTCQFFTYRWHARLLLRKFDIQQTSEWKTAQWLATNMPTGRVMVPGSVSFWLNAFADTPQLTGCCQQGSLDRTIAIAQYVIQSDDSTAGKEFETSVQWLKVFGVQAIGVAGPGSSEFYKAIRKWDKFEGRLPVLWRDGDDVVYQIPQRTNSLAHVIHAGDQVSRTPVNGIDLEPLSAYLRALDDASLPEAGFQWTTHHSAKINAILRAGDYVSVQIPMHPGWHATAKGTAIPITQDGLGLILMKPSTSGPMEISMSFDGDPEMKRLRLLCAVSLASAAGLPLLQLWNKRTRSAARDSTIDGAQS
jgi:hypothetical protein